MEENLQRLEHAGNVSVGHRLRQESRSNMSDQTCRGRCYRPFSRQAAFNQMIPDSSYALVPDGSVRYRPWGPCVVSRRCHRSNRQLKALASAAGSNQFSSALSIRPKEGDAKDGNHVGYGNVLASFQSRTEAAGTGGGLNGRHVATSLHSRLMNIRYRTCQVT